MKVYVRDIATRESVKEIDMGESMSRHNFDKFQRGILHNMGDRYFLDTSEVDAYLEAKEETKEGR